MYLFRALLFVILVVASAAPTAAAAETGKADAGIEDQVSQGIALRRSGNDDAALGIFLDLEKRAPDSVRVLLHICTAALATGRWTMAYDYLQKASSHKDDPYYQRHKAAIDNVERAILQRVGQFRARGSPPGAEVRLSGELVGTLPMAGAKAIEVGSYMLEVSKAGYFPLRRPITIAGDGSLTQESIDLREQKPFTISTGPGQTALQGGTSADVPVGPASWWRARWVTWSLAGVGIAAAATGGAALAIREVNVAHWNDNSRCLDSTAGGIRRTRADVCSGVRSTIDTAQEVGITAGIAALVFGGAALVHGLSTSDHGVDVTTPKTQTEAACSPGVASIVCSGSF